MDNIELKVEKRDVLVKKTRFMRREGTTPCHIFGHNIESQSLQCTTTALEKTIKQAGTSRLINLQVGGDKEPIKVFIREIQRHPVRDSLFHVDFYQIKMTERMKAEIPIVIRGEAPALKGKGHILTYVLNTIGVESLPDKLPPQLVLDISGLEEVNQSILIKDIDLGTDVTVTNEPEQVIVKISEVAAARIEEEEEEAAAAAALAAEGEETTVEGEAVDTEQSTSEAKTEG